jgi:hypothetical protein
MTKTPFAFRATATRRPQRTIAAATTPARDRAARSDSRARGTED